MKYLGKKLHIQGLDIRLPKPGYVYNRINRKYERVGIYKRSRSERKQYWELLRPKGELRDALVEEAVMRIKNPEYVDPDCERYRAQEFYRRLNGFWFYNNGKPEFITGLHYYYLNWYYIGDTESGYPDFWHSDALFFYFLQYSIQDPRSCGTILVTKRRAGKTQKSGAFLLEPISRMRNVHGGIQSKTDDDAKITVYTRSVVNAFKKMPDFFRPEYDKRKISSALLFTSSDPERSLDSSITQKSSKVLAYDGEALYRYVGDEIFKTPLNIVDRHDVVKYCLTDTNGRFRGKALYTSTVEEIESQPELINLYRRFWADSNPAIRNEATGRTDTGLYRYYQPADELRDRDIYGYCDVAKNREFILASRPAKGSRGYLSAVRKESLSIEEAFASANRECIWNAEIISKQIDFLSFQNEDSLYKRGNLAWLDGIRFGKVIFIENPNGRFLIHKLPSDQMMNAVKCRGGHYAPLASHLCASGLDPYDYSITESGGGSNAAFYIKAKPDVANPEYSNRILLEYIGRYPIEVFYEDIIMAMFFYGVPVLAESNKVGFIKHCESLNLHAFLVKLPDKKKPGIYSSSEAKQQAAQLNEIYLSNNCEKIVFLRLLTSMLGFDISHTEKFDETMAWLWTLLSEHITSVGYKPKSGAKKLELKRIFR